MFEMFMGIPVPPSTISSFSALKGMGKDFFPFRFYRKSETKEIRTAIGSKGNIRKELKDLESAVGAIFEFRSKLFPASGAHTRCFGMKKIRLGASAFIEYTSAAVAF